MNGAALSVFVWGIYIAVLGSGLLFFPGKILPLFGHDKPKDFWIRVFGLVVIVLGYYYIDTAVHDITRFFWISVYGRYAVTLGELLLVASKRAPKAVIPNAVIEAGGATWTLIVLM